MNNRWNFPMRKSAIALGAALLVSILAITDTTFAEV